jgi:hypothetical protein
VSEQYYRNVQALCDKLGIPNPIQEEDVKIFSLKIYQITSSVPIEIVGTEKNRASRVFLQEEFQNAKEGLLLSAFKSKAADFFAEFWCDAEEVGRPLLVALKNPLSHLVEIQWK